MKFKGALVEELKSIAEGIIAEEFRMGFASNVIPADSDETDVNSLYEFNVDLLCELLSTDPALEAILVESKRQNVKISLADLFSACLV